MAKREEWIGGKFGAYNKLSDIVKGVAKPSLDKFGWEEGRLFSGWSEAVGREISSKCQPKSLKFPRGKKNGATLTVEVEDSFAVEIAHMENILIDKISVLFGYKLVDKIKILQKPTDKTD